VPAADSSKFPLPHIKFSFYRTAAPTPSRVFKPPAGVPSCSKDGKARPWCFMGPVVAFYAMKPPLPAVANLGSRLSSFKLLNVLFISARLRGLCLLVSSNLPLALSLGLALLLGHGCRKSFYLYRICRLVNQTLRGLSRDEFWHSSPPLCRTVLGRLFLIVDGSSALIRPCYSEGIL
jgi:hypothetical protein